MLTFPSVPTIVACSGCALALIVGVAFRFTNALGQTARLGFLPKSLTRWLLDTRSINVKSG
jgi:hypothetical protein